MINPTIAVSMVPLSLTALQQYLQLGQVTEGDKFDLLKYWWALKGRVHEVLFASQRDWLAAQATSCSCERAASAGKVQLNGKDCLGEDNFRLEVLMRSWNINTTDYLDESQLKRKREMEAQDNLIKKRAKPNDTVCIDIEDE